MNKETIIANTFLKQRTIGQLHDAVSVARLGYFTTICWFAMLMTSQWFREECVTTTMARKILCPVDDIPLLNVDGMSQIKRPP